MSDFFVAPIVEGHGEVQALPILLQRILDELRADATIRFNPALRVKVGSFLNDQEYFAKHLELAARKAKPHAKGFVLILLDCEDQCPAQLGRSLAAKAVQLRSDVPSLVVLAYREYETWFLAAARSLRGVGDLPADLEPPPAPEMIRDAKGWLGDRLPGGYNPPNHQPIFTRKFAFDEAASIPSFTRMRERLRGLLAT